MKIDKYLNRIEYNGSKTVSAESLSGLHTQHIFHVPFENLDIQCKSLLNLEISSIYDKVVNKNRGGFCYELNYLFCELLSTLGYKSKIIAARIFLDNGELGPDYDHMSIHIELDKSYLADVGFGDLFIKPLEIKEGIQSDGRNFFTIESTSGEDFLLSMGPDPHFFKPKYTFTLRPVLINNFHQISIDKQTNPESHFVKNTICTKPTESGRYTIFNDKFIERIGQKRIETSIKNEEELLEILNCKFGIILDNQLKKSTS